MARRLQFEPTSALRNHSFARKVMKFTSTFLPSTGKVMFSLEAETWTSKAHWRPVSFLACPARHACQALSVT